MVDCIFTLDYEIYGDGVGTLADLVYEPAERLKDVFRKWSSRFVTFVEVLELERIESYGTDPAIKLVREQIKELYRDSFEIGLHLHPQWCNARYEQGRWCLDYGEYNLCTLPRSRIERIVEASLDYLRSLVDDADFNPLSFRAGNWLFQPTQIVSSVLAEKGLRVDSSVFKGGLQHSNILDYRRTLRNGNYWFFGPDVIEPDPTGHWLEVPIYTEMVPFWRMPTSKRLSFAKNVGLTRQVAKKKLKRVLDFLRFRYPLKLDFCRMTLKELISTVGKVIREDRTSSAEYKPIVAIGHTKDLIDLQTVDLFLRFLHDNGAAVSTLKEVFVKVSQERQLVPPLATASPTS